MSYIVCNYAYKGVKINNLTILGILTKIKLNDSRLRFKYRLICITLNYSVSTINLNTNFVTNYVLPVGLSTDSVYDLILNDDKNLLYLGTDSYVVVLSTIDF